jgi:hypothetical protein
LFFKLRYLIPVFITINPCKDAATHKNLLGLRVC